MSDGAPASAISKADSKRLALSRDQRAVLEAVYAVEKLPDAALRDRLSKYLDLSTRQSKACAQSHRPSTICARGRTLDLRICGCTPCCTSARHVTPRLHSISYHHCASGCSQSKYGSRIDDSVQRRAGR